MSIYDKLVGVTSEGVLPPAVREHLPQVETTPLASSVSVDYWVSPGGDDGAVGSQSAPFRTLAHAVGQIPDMVRADHTYTITLAPGVWDEMVAIDHRIVYGHVIIQGSTEDREAHKVDIVRCETILGMLTVRNITATRKRANGASFRFIRCSPMVRVENVKAESDPSVEKGQTGVIGLLADYGSQVFVSYSDFGGKRYGMRANYLSRIFSHNNTGSGSTFGLGARWGGIMTSYGTQPTGDTDRTNSSGGILTFEHGGKLGLPDEIGLISTAGHGDNAPVIKRYHLNSSNSGISGNLTDGQVIRSRFRAPIDGYTSFRVSYGARTNSSGAQGIEKHFYGVIRRDSFTPAGETTIHSHNFGSQVMEIVHTGANGIFDLRIAPLAALSGQWAIDIEITYHRNLDSPVLESVTLV